MPTQTVNGVTISYTESGSGPPLVFVHGFPLDARMWDEQVRALARSHRAIAPDLRGFGKSPSLEPFTIDALADDVHALLRQAGALPCALCGLSMGGYVALALAKKCPTDLRALVLVDTRAEGDTAEAKANRQKMIDLVRQGGAKAVAEQMLPKLLSEQTRRSSAGVVERVRAMIEACPPRTIEHALLALRDRHDYTADLPSIPVPTLILVGEHDAITPPELSRAMHAKIPRSELSIIPGAGHMSPMEQPEAVNRELERFLRAVP